MCGRYTVTKNREKIEEFFNIKDSDFLYSEIFNAYPSQELPIITSSEQDKMSFFRWGLIPFWAKDPSISNKLINARSETIIEKPSFKHSFKKRRCLVIADGYYEWKTTGKEKQPYRIKLKNDQLFAMAGIYDFWKDGNDNIIKTFSIITTSANDFLSEIHSRMPVIFDQKEQLKLWLDNSTDEIKALDMLKTMDSEFFDAEMVSKKINVPSHNQLEFI